jgi:hypothetical protein
MIGSDACAGRHLGGTAADWSSVDGIVHEMASAAWPRKVPLPIGISGIQAGRAARHTPADMTQLEMELASLRKRRTSPGFMAWFRSLRPFDRRSIRVPDERDAYWATVQRRLAESDAAFLTRYNPYPSAARRQER